MTALAQQATDDFNLLALIADGDTPLSKPFADRFRDACKAEADAHEGWVNPNSVRVALLAGADEFTYREAKQYAGLWSKAAGRHGFLDVPDRKNTVLIEGPGSTRNGGKGTPMRFWRGWGK